MSRKKSNTTLVREYIHDLIVREGLKPGDMLPCEGEIASTLEISKSCVREATHALESIGLIEIRHGIGLELRPFNFDAMGEIFNFGFALDPSIVIDLYDLRRQMESSMMPRVVEHIDDQHIAACEEILLRWEKLAQDNVPTYDVDRQFHETLYSVVDNRMLTSLCHLFWTEYQDLEGNNQLMREEPNNKETACRTIAAHRQILEAVREKDAQKATRLMYDHFRRINRKQKPEKVEA